MRTKSISHYLLATSLVALAATAQPAFAQAPADAAAAEDVGLGEIIVTGEKRETRLQDIPMAITAIDSETLRARNIAGIDNLDGYVPGLSVTNNQGAERVVTIRGIGYETASNPNSFPGVAFHIDGIYVAHSHAIGQDLIDIERIEVLRGPQGTVFGETSTGGAINVILKKPTLGKTSGEAAVSYGNYNYVKGFAAANVPLGDSLALRVAAQYLRHDGYGKQYGVPGTSDRSVPLDDANNFTGRFSLLYEPDDTFSATLEGTYFHTDRAGPLQKSATDTTPGLRNVTQDLLQSYKLDTRMIYLTLSKSLSDTIVAKSVTAYQYMHHYQITESDRTADDAQQDHLTPWEDISKTFSQELSVSSQNTKMLEWTVGGLYLRQRAIQNIFESASEANPRKYFLPTPSGAPYIFQTDSPYQHTSIGVYGQATAHLTDAFSLTGGVRYSWDKVSAQPYQFYAIVPPRSVTSDQVTGKVSAEYKLTPLNSVYVTASSGYKPTGVSFVQPGYPLFVPDSFKKETVQALEAGSKNQFFDRRLTINVAGYYYWYKNFQFTAEDPIPFAGGTDNIPKAEVWGAELEASAQPTSQLRLDGTFSWGKGKFTSDKLVLDAQTAAGVRNAFPSPFMPEAIAAAEAAAQNVNGKRLPKMPTTTATGSAAYTFPLPMGDLTMRGEVSYRGKYNYRIFGISQFDEVPAYTIVNAYIAYQPKDAPWKLSVTATNLFDKTAITSRFADPYGSGTTSVQYMAPRQVFGTVQVKF